MARELCTMKLEKGEVEARGVSREVLPAALGRKQINHAAPFLQPAPEATRSGPPGYGVLPAGAIRRETHRRTRPARIGAVVEAG